MGTVRRMHRVCKTSPQRAWKSWCVCGAWPWEMIRMEKSHQTLGLRDVVRTRHLAHGEAQAADGVAHGAHVAHPIVQKRDRTTLPLRPLPQRRPRVHAGGDRRRHTPSAVRCHRQ